MLHMAKILENRQLCEDFFLMRVSQKNSARMGQFYMLRAWGHYPMLSRPISVFDSDGETASFLYKVVGEGTRAFAGLRPGDEIGMIGPNGGSFPQLCGKIALVGGGVGIAPLYLAAKQLKENAPGNQVDIYLGFSGTPVLTKEYEQLASCVTTNVGGFITDDINPAAYDAVFTCGPEIMMKVLRDKCRASGVAGRLYVSMEARMGCGFGICVGCAARIKDEEGGFTHKKVCLDGPVFRGEEVLFDE